MEINIKPEDIDAYVKEVLLECTIGKQVKAAIEKSLKDLFEGYRNPIKGFVEETLREMVKLYLQKEEVKPIIYAAIAKGLAPETIELIVSNAAYDLQQKIKERSE